MAGRFTAVATDSFVAPPVKAGLIKKDVSHDFTAVAASG